MQRFGAYVLRILDNNLEIFKFQLKAKPAIMKKVIIHLIAIMVFLCSPLFINSIFADQPPDPGGGPGGEPVGGGAPIGGGLIIMAALGVAYGTKKAYDARKKLM